MARTLEVSVTPAKTDEVIARFRRLDGVVGLTLQRGASLEPPGDVVTIRTTNAGLEAACRALDELDVADIVTSEPHSLIAPRHQGAIERESNETIWEEVASLLRRDSNVSSNYLALMALSGAIAGAGLWTDTLHVVVGAMLLAPGFEPLARVPFALIAGPASAALRGLASTAAGYAALALGAAVAALLLQAVGPSGGPDPGARFWVQYWSSVPASGVVVALIAGAAGAVILTSRRTVFAAGVMVALALIPAMAIVGLGLVTGDTVLAAQGLARWSTDALAVIVATALVLGVKQAFGHRRRGIG